MNYLIFFCPACKHTTAVPEEQVKPGPVYCGRCHTEKGRRVQVRRDLTAEGVIPDAMLSRLSGSPVNFQVDT